MKTFLALIASLLFCLSAFGQTAPPPAQPDPLEGAWNISVNGSYSNVSDAATNNGFVTTEAFRIAQHWNLRSDQFIVLNPSSVIVLAGPEYRLNLSHFLATSAFTANASKIEAFVNVKAGTARSSAIATDGTTTLSAAHFAYGVGGGFDILVNSTLSLRPLDISYVRAPMLTNGGAVLGNHLQFATGLGLRF